MVGLYGSLCGRGQGAGVRLKEAMGAPASLQEGIGGQGPCVTQVGLTNGEGDSSGAHR